MKTKKTKAKSLNREKYNKLPPTKLFERRVASIPHQSLSPELDYEIGLLIGYNCPQILLPRDVIMGDEDKPYAQRSALFWSIIGCSNVNIDCSHEAEIGVSHHILVKQVLPATKLSSELKSEVQFVCRAQVKETITPSDILKV